MTQCPLIFRKGLDLKHEVAQVLADSYHSELVAAIKESDYRFESGLDAPSRPGIRFLLRGGPRR